ncbi:hypothetical protein ANO11243_049820 [Dothideomycetidae sp. 11243]|nr:hypothetical protein ANO11243_049820 [fungal sp. No.11243]
MQSKVALISASSAGLGASTARVFAAAGYRVVINYHSNAEKAQALVKEIQQHDDESRRAIAIKADMSRRSGISHLVSEAVNAMGRLDVVVSNQGWTRMRKFDDLDDNLEEDDWDTCFNVNVKSHLYFFHAARPHLVAAGGGSFITVASIAGVVPSGSSLAYSVTKAAQIHLMRALAKIAGPNNIRVNSVSPGIMLTDVAQQILLLGTSKSITGCNAVVDCGWSML